MVRSDIVMPREGFSKEEEKRLDPLPAALDAASTEISELAEGGGGEIKIAPVAAGAAVDDGDVDGAAVGGDADAAAAEGVVVGVAVGGGRVELGLVQGGDELAVVVPAAAGAEAGVVPGEGARVAGDDLDGGALSGSGGGSSELEEGDKGSGNGGLGEEHFELFV